MTILWVAGPEGFWSAPPPLEGVRVARTSVEARAASQDDDTSVVIVVPVGEADFAWGLLPGSPARAVALPPVVVVCDPESRARAWEAGAFEVLASEPAPDGPEAVAAVIERALHYRRLVSSFRRERSHLASVLSHDLKNPLSAVLMTAHMLQSRLPEKDRPAIDRIRRAGQRMQRMIQEIVDFTHLQQGTALSLRPHACDLGRLCRHAIEELARVQPGQTVIFEGERPLPGTWDGERLEQMVFHVLSHALLSGLGAEGTTLTLAPEGGNEVTLVMSCRGPALAEQDRAALLDPLRADPRSALARSGMGLFIARAIAEAHGGVLELGAAGTGSFEVTLRLPRGLKAPAPPV